MCSLEFYSVLLLIVVIVIFQCDHEHSVCSKAYNFTNLSLKHERFIWYNTSIDTLDNLAFGNVGEPSRLSGGSIIVHRVKSVHGCSIFPCLIWACNHYLYYIIAVFLC